MPVNKIGGSSIRIRRREAARPRDLRSGGCKDWRQMFHERGAQAAGSHEETRRIAANIAKLPDMTTVFGDGLRVLSAIKQRQSN
jgi:hypothetical protein